ncbi:MAG: RNA polymerase sigma factor [Bacteroidetes bacterium]|nr:RNA polymerase sigma factor [Bacteroidota bacterium]
MPATPAHDEELFREFLAGSDAAFSDIYRRHHHQLYAYCARMLDDAAAAADIAHQVWERMIALRSSPTELRNPLGFMYRMARNAALDHRKHLRYQRSIESLTESDHPQSQSHEPSAEEEIVIGCLQRLTPEKREVLVLNYYSGYSFEEIATILGKSPTAIYARASRARAELKQLVEDQLAIFAKEQQHG